MALVISDLQVVLSGGAGNTLPTASLGGARSTAGSNRVISQTTGSVTNTSGVTVRNAWNNTVGGSGTLYWFSGSNTLSWRAPGAAGFVGKEITGDGVYVLGGSDGYLEVDVVQASLPGVDTQDTLSVTSVNQNVFQSVPESVSLIGNTYYRGLYLYNSNSVDTAINVRVWIPSNTDAGDEISVALDPAGLNATMAGPLADQEDSTDVLSAVSFTIPTTYSGGLVVGNIPANQHYGIWLRQHIPPETRGTVLDNSASIAIAADV